MNLKDGKFCFQVQQGCHQDLFQEVYKLKESLMVINHYILLTNNLTESKGLLLCEDYLLCMEIEVQSHFQLQE